MQKQASDHIDQSIKTLESGLQEIKDLIEGMDSKSLNQLEGPKKWSILQTLEHLTLANTLYVKNIDNAYQKYSEASSEVYKSHWKGDWFTRLIFPKENGEIKNKMNTVGFMAPDVNLEPEKTIDNFFTVHQKFIDQMKKARDYDLNKVKVVTGFGPMVKLRLGDVFNFLIGHIQRHILQIKRIKKAIN